MCEQCIAKTVSYGEVFPGWTLVRATQNGHQVREGDWALLRSNDPDIVWSVDLLLDPSCDIDLDSDSAEKKLSACADASYDFMRALYAFEEAMRDAHLDLMTSADLVSACESRGYDKDVFGYRIEMWMAHMIAQWIIDHPQWEYETFA